MLFLFVGVLVLTAFGAFGLQVFFKMSTLRSSETTGSLPLAADRYRPMLRLLSNADLAFVSADSNLQRKLRAKRRELFRGYLRCLTRDYGILLAGIRQAMVQSGIDRPDLARALTRNRTLFAFAVCKIELRLALHATRADNVDVSVLVSALETLCGQSSRLSTASIAA
jgi:hypothetical protein